ncbi:uncharacterized protein THITE_2117217 [Thermothielavioides terrestris NRRL 8126]|uniref:RING-type E3 ubiquitin transferase n=1 Tax=Thermothielavioides terrestris (strain ATCC 38088 / NRRL 8126) TaxID=578455 RepID=G2R7S0_THETT|nr:uncharacterized protein THITE_2117217 [Thermothielavioides terrestris NRRL 8126]AEO67979.1 hypothetical protein THITE_2117217 [Thermothielavioides terrestris NRRL 8126]
MDTGARSDDTDDANDIHAQVLRTTLGEIETSQRESEDGTADSRDCCVICLDSISDACAALPCGHAHFDFLCLLSWLQQHPNCPLCKANVYKVRYADAQQAEAIYRVPNAARPRGGMRDERTGDARRQSPLDSAFRRRFTSQNGLLRETGSRRPRTPPSPNEALERRRYVYRHQLYSLHIGSNRTSQYRPPPTPVQFSSTPHLVSRARMWIRRELQVFPFLCSPDPDPIPTGLSIEEARHRQRLRNNAEFLLEYIIAILKTVDLQDSAGQAEAMLADFLGRDNVRLFLHELRSWLRSPAPTLAAWDREVQYPCRPEPVAAAYPEDESWSARRSSSRSRIVMASTGDDVEGRVGGSGMSWRDRGGDHWRAETGQRLRKRKVRDGDGVAKGRVSRTRGRGDVGM